MAKTKAEPAAETAVVKTEAAAVEKLPAFLAESTGVGTEGMGREDVQTPRLKLAQGLSPQMLRSDPSYVKGLQLGDAFNDLTGEILGQGPFSVIVIRMDRARWVEFDPDDRKVVLDREVAPGDERTLWTTDEKGKRQKPRATKFYDFVVLLGEAREPIALSFSSTGIKTVSTLRGYIGMIHRQTGKPLDLFAKRYEIRSVEMKNDKGTWYGWAVSQAGLVSEKEYKYARGAFDIFKEKAVEFDRGTEDAEEAPEPGSDM